MKMKTGTDHVTKGRSMYDDVLLPNGTTVTLNSAGSIHSSHSQGSEYSGWKRGFIMREGTNCVVCDSFYCQSNSRRLYVIENIITGEKVVVSAYGLFVGSIKREHFEDNLFQI